MNDSYFPSCESRNPIFRPSTIPSPILTFHHGVTIDIGGIPILVRTDSPDFARMLEDRYGEFVTAGASAAEVELEITLAKEPGFEIGDSGFEEEADAEVSVRVRSGRWSMERGDFRAEWDPKTNRGWVLQTVNPYSIDGVLRILHSLILARAGGFLVHAASAVRNSRAFVFAGVSGTGKTTLARLAPPDVTLLTDEISYVSPKSQIPELEATSRESEVKSTDSGMQMPDSESRTPSTESRVSAFEAFGTPFAGELARIGQKVRSPLATLFLLQQGPENRIEPVNEAQAVRELMRHVLFFAQDEELVGMVFQTVCNFVKRVPVRRLVFTPDARVWELIA